MPDNDRTPRRPGSDGPGPIAPRTRLTPWILIALVVLALLAFNQWFSSASRKQISYTQYQQYVTDGKITAVTISDNSISGTYKDPQTNQDVAFTTTLSNNFQTQDEVTYLTSLITGSPSLATAQAAWMTTNANATFTQTTGDAGSQQTFAQSTANATSFPGAYPAVSMASRITLMASSSSRRSGAKPPSSPTPVASLRLTSTFLRQ